uniref:Xanthine dehydrogenase n=2 Tax=Ditylum brightwellii TaxID=49249 RepID=A0A7S4RBL2_9STRA|mmetsp:Transcript_8196/g.11783  ORF Transcript_8196/g.11783 Transcript_8196/m.11783 type:complete len:930 (+) Transcript_8196:135-2924(+)
MPPNKSGLNVLSYENDDDLDLLYSFKKRGYRTTPILYVNGKQISPDLARKARPNQTLLSFLRDVLRLTGSKLGCAEGGCGACTVMISRFEKSNTASSNDEGTNDDNDGGAIKHYAVNACLMPVLAADGCHITTVEGVGSVKDDNLHPIQRAMVDMHGSQCGFCTPGIIVAIYSLLANNATTAHMEEHLDGNLCRCTGYRPIWDAARSLCSDIEDVCTNKVHEHMNAEMGVIRGPCGTPCRSCPERDSCEMDCNAKDKENGKTDQKEKSMENGGGAKSAPKENLCCSSSVDKMSSYQSVLPKDSASSWRNQPIDMFPDSLTSAPDSEIGMELFKPLLVVDSTAHGRSTWMKPTTILELLSLLRQYGESDNGCKIIVGNTEVGIETKFKHAVYPCLIYPSQTIDSLYDITITSTHFRLGACTSLGTVQQECERLIGNANVDRIAKPIYNMLRWFASTQIRNVACLGGNLVTASPISDMNPMLVSMNANLVVASISSISEGSITRRIIPVLDFFCSYRTVDLKPYELVECIDVPLTREIFEYVVPFKQARRREDDISIVTSGMRIILAPKESEHYVIEDMTLAFGGMAPTTIVASETASNLIGMPFCAQTFKKGGEILREELKLPDDVPGGQAEYRITVASSFLYQFFLTVATELKMDADKIQMDPIKYGISIPLPPLPLVEEEEMSGTQQFVSSKKPSSLGMQTYPTPKVVEGIEKKISPTPATAALQTSSNSLGKPLPHASAPFHCTGEAIYVDDIPTPPSTLHAFLLLATECDVTLKSINKEAALKIPGVVDVYTHDDLVKLGGENAIGPIMHDECVFLPVGEKIVSVGQVLGIVIGNSIEISEIGARSVKVEYGEKQVQTIVSIDDAIKAGSFYEFARHTLERGDVDSVFCSSDNKEEEKEPLSMQPRERVVKVEGSFRCGGQEHFCE